MKIYIAGPISGIPQFNAPAFDQAESLWRAAGHTPINPMAIDRALGIDINGPTSQVEGSFGRQAIACDIQYILNCNGIALLPGWKKSRGAAVELALAQFLNLPVYDALTLARIFPIGIPWWTLSDKDHTSDAT